jgi:hypothetical protein
MDGQKAVILAQVGQFHFGAVGQFSIGGDIHHYVVFTRTRETRTRASLSPSGGREYGSAHVIPWGTFGGLALA